MKRNGFSLIELLVVVAVIGVLTAIALPVLGGRTSTINHASLQLPLLLEQARTYAMSHNTYVWVGFFQDTANGRLAVASIAGTSGQASDIATSEFRPIGRIQYFDQVELYEGATAPPGLEPGAQHIFASKIADFTQPVQQMNRQFGNSIQFNPDGSVRIEENTISRWTELRLRRYAGAYKDNDNVMAIQISCLTGKVKLFRP